MTPAEWLALAERCEKATEPERLNSAVAELLGLYPYGYEYRHGADIWVRVKGAGPLRWSPPRWDMDLNAITSLIVSEISNSWPVFTIQGDDRYDPEPRRCWHKREITVPSSGFRGEAPTPARALLAAFCRAKAQEASNADQC